MGFFDNRCVKHIFFFSVIRMIYFVLEIICKSIDQTGTPCCELISEMSLIDKWAVRCGKHSTRSSTDTVLVTQPHYVMHLSNQWNLPLVAVNCWPNPLSKYYRGSLRLVGELASYG